MGFNILLGKTQIFNEVSVKQYLTLRNWASIISWYRIF